MNKLESIQSSRNHHWSKVEVKQSHLHGNKVFYILIGCVKEMSIRQNVKTYQKGQSLGQVDVATKCSGQAKTPLSHNSRKKTG